MIAALGSALGAIAVLGLLVRAVFIVCARRTRGHNASVTAHRPPVSVLRPVCGLDDEFEKNLEAVCELDYPRYEVIVVAADPHDEALAVAQRIVARHQRVPIRIVVGMAQLGRNRKVSNLIHAARAARHEWLLISDSNVRPHRDYLARLADEAAVPGVGMVANLIVGGGAQSLGARLENLQLNGYLLPATVAAGLFRDVPCVMGKSMFFRRSDLDAIGGFASVADHLAEDFLLARAFHTSGRRVVISTDALRTVNRTWSVMRFLSRHVRWNQIRFRMSPVAYLAEIFATPAVPALAMLGLGAWCYDPRMVAMAVCLLGGRVVLEAVAAKIAAPTCGFEPEVPGLVILRDLLIGVVWLIAPWKSTVRWRGSRYRIGAETHIEPVTRRPRNKRLLGPEAA